MKLGNIFDSSSFANAVAGIQTNNTTAQSQASEMAFLERQSALIFKQTELEMKQAELVRYKDEHTARMNLSNILLTITVVWMLLILVLIVACGQGKLKLSDTVLVTLITTTTVNVFGFLLIVVKYLFNENKSS